MYICFFKRISDIIISLIGLPFFILLYLPICILIKIEDGGPVFYNAIRMGRNMVPFIMFKFRTMKVNSQDIRLKDGSTYNAINDPRVTKIGRFLRETSLDEIPQMLNILMGEMSVIGPRPDPIDIYYKYPEELKLVLSVRPGLTGYCQAYYRNETDTLGKIEKDIYYVRNMSFILDMKVFLKSFYTVLKQEKIYKEETNLPI